MSILPEFLTESYDLLLNSDIVKNKNITLETIQEFVRLLNNSIPNKYTTEYTIYLFNRTKYKTNRWKFIKDINDSPYRSMILWTNYKEILKHFDLVQRFYLKWDKELNKYVGDEYDPSKHIKQQLKESVQEERHEDSKAEEIEEQNEESEEKEISQQELADGYMDDTDKLMEYMQKRKKELEERLKNQ